MTVREVVALAAKELGIYEDIEENLTTGATKGKDKVDLLVDCFNLVENELALDYLPLQAQDEMVSDTGRIEFSTMKYNIVRIIRVEDEWGNSVKFELFPTYLKTQPGKLKITYTYTPEKKDINGESDYVLYVSERMFAYGVAAEYTLASGMYEETAVWDKKYKQAIEAAYRLRPCKRIGSRRWV